MSEFAGPADEVRGEGDLGRRAESPSHGPRAYHFRDALRLLFILAEGSEVVREGGQRVFIGEKRAMAVDFLVRYPDYLADALLDLYQKERDPLLLKEVKRIFEAEEPDVRLVEMVRWRRGAFQNIETALAILDSRRLVRSMKRKLAGNRFQHEYFVEPLADKFLEEATRDQPSLRWYRDRARLAMRIARFRSGSDLKGAQYEHEEYRDTPFGAVIPVIKDRVRERFERIASEAI